MFKRNLKRAITLAMVTCMVVGSAAGCGNKNDNETPTPTPTTAADNKDNNNDNSVADKSGLEFSVDYAANKVDVGSTTATLGEAGGDGVVGYDVYAGTAGKDYTDSAVYTYNDYISGTSNMKWSTHTWETSDDSYVLDFISSGFYGFALNSTKDGWSVTCEMASELPVDVTADYVGSYGIEAGDTAQAWKITLNPLACWEDGTPINADSYIYSYKELLDPVMKNRRADSLYAGDFVIYNAKNYFYQGSSAFTALGVTASDYIAAGGSEADIYVDMASFWGVDSPDGTGYALVTDDTLVRDPAVTDESNAEAYVSAKYLYETYLASGCPYESYAATYLGTLVSYPAGMDFSEVGIIKTGEYELVFITTAPIATPNYYVPYNLSSTYLVYEPMWEACKSYYDGDGNKVTADSDNIVLITTNYCTSAETTMAYGPYRLSYFELDKQITFERNENWYGYKDGKHVGQYQTDIISCQVVGEHDTAMLMFEKGEIDNIGLDSDDMEKYGSSSYIRYTPQSYTTKLTWNTDAESLATRGTQILTNANFRKAFAFALDRQTFTSSYTAAAAAGYGMLNYMYLYDPLSGGIYRETDGAKKALVELYEVTYGENGEYGDLDEAYEAITGYDIAYAQKLMAKAYEECVADGTYDGTSNVEITLSVYNSEDIYVQMFNFFQDALQQACKGTGFEGKVSFTMVADADYYETMYSGGTDMIFSTWGGAASTPYTVLYQCYCDSATGEGNQMEYGFETDKVMVTMNINGKQYTNSLQTWALWANNDLGTVIKSDDGTTTLEPFANYDNDTRADIFGRMEYSFLCFFTTTPLYYRQSASLVSQKGDYAISTYIDLISFGGLQFYTYNYDDAQWAEVVKNGLTY